MSYPRYQMSDASKAPGGSSLQEAVSAKLDDFFTEYMELYAAVRAERVEAHAALSKGFFALAEARHSKPGITLDSTAYSGREMLPLHAWSARSVYPPEEGETLPTSLAMLATQCASHPMHFEVAAAELKDEDAEDEAEAEAEAAAAAVDGVRKRAGKGEQDSAAALASSLATTSLDGAATPAAALDLRTSPLQWFGVLAPPSLPTAADSFRASLHPLARVASLASRMKELERKFAALSALQQASHVDPQAQEQLKAVLEKIKITDERKKKEKEEAEAAKPAAAAAAATEPAAAASSSAATAAAAAAAAASS